MEENRKNKDVRVEVGPVKENPRQTERLLIAANGRFFSRFGALRLCNLNLEKES